MVLELLQRLAAQFIHSDADSLLLEFISYAHFSVETIYNCSADLKSEVVVYRFPVILAWSFELMFSAFIRSIKKIFSTGSEEVEISS